MACKTCNLIVCGCQDSYLTTPPPCPVPSDCPTVQPCSEVFDSQCVIYSGDDITCNAVVLASTGTPVNEALVNIANYFCSDTVLTSDVMCGADIVVPINTSAIDAVPLIAAYFCTAVTTIQGDITTIQGDITTIQGDVTTLQSDVTALQTYDTFLTGLISQSGAAIPTLATPTNGNTIGTIVWSYDGVGIYTGTLVGAFTGAVICTLVQGSWTFQPPGFYQISRLTDDTIQIRTFDATGTLADDMMANANIRIEQYVP